MGALDIKQFPGEFPHQGQRTAQSNGLYIHPASPEVAIVVHRGRVMLYPGMARPTGPLRPIRLPEVRGRRAPDGFYLHQLLPDTIVLVRQGLPHVLDGMIPAP